MSIFDGDTHIIQLSGVSHCQRIPADTQTVFGRKDPARLRVWLKGAQAVSPPIFLEGDEMEAFIREWREYCGVVDRSWIADRVWDNREQILGGIDSTEKKEPNPTVMRDSWPVPDDIAPGDTLLWVAESGQWYTNGKEYVVESAKPGGNHFRLSDNGDGHHGWDLGGIKNKFRFVSRRTPEAESDELDHKHKAGAGSTTYPV